MNTFLQNDIRKYGKSHATYLDLRDFGFRIDKPEDIRYWYANLKQNLFHKRGQRSALTGQIIKGPIDCHHGIVLRSTISKSIWWHPLIHAEVNLFLLSREEHTKPPSKQRCWTIACKMYGKEVMEKWYFGLPWKLRKPPQYFE